MNPSRGGLQFLEFLFGVSFTQLQDNGDKKLHVVQDRSCHGMDIHRLRTSREDKGPRKKRRAKSKLEMGSGWPAVVEIEPGTLLKDGIAFKRHGNDGVISLKTVRLRGKSGMYPCGIRLTPMPLL